MSKRNRTVGTVVGASLLTGVLVVGNQTLSALGTSGHAPTVAGQAEDTWVLASTPSVGAKKASIDGGVKVQFALPVQAASLTSKSLTLLGPQGPVDGDIVSSPDRHEVSFIPKAQLLPQADYTLFLNGVVSEAGKAMPMKAIAFRTTTLGGESDQPGVVAGKDKGGAIEAVQTAASWDAAVFAHAKIGQQLMPVPAAATSKIDNGDWHPGKDALDGHWRVNKPMPKQPAAPKEVVAKNSAALFGQVLRVDDQPLSNVKISIGDRTVQTDNNGQFLIRDLKPGAQQIFFDATVGGQPLTGYGQIQMGVDLKAGKVNTLPQQIFLSAIHAQDHIKLDSPTTHEVVLTHPEMPGFELHIPAGTVLRDHNGHIVNEVALVPTPIDRAPHSLPTQFPVYFMLQPGGTTVQSISTQAANGIRVIYPNYDHALPGTRLDFWAYGADGSWKTYGKGQVTADARQIMPDPGVALYQFMGAGNAPGTGPGGSSPGCGCGGGGGGGGNGGGGSGPGSDNWPSIWGATGGDPVDLASGTFTGQWTDFHIDDIIPIDLTRSYRSGYSTSYAFGTGMSFNYGMRLVTPTTFNGVNNYGLDVVEILLPDNHYIPFFRVQGQEETWKDTFGGSSFTGATLQFNNLSLYGSTYTVTQKDGTRYVFSASGQSPLTAVQDRYGNTLTLNYDAGSRLSSIISPSGRSLTFTYSSSNPAMVDHVTDHAGRTVRYGYTGNNLTTVTYSDTSYVQYEYDQNLNYITKVHDRNGNLSLTNVYDQGTGRVHTQTLSDSTLYTFTYVTNGSGVVTSMDAAMTDPVSNQTVDRHLTFDQYLLPLTDTWGWGNVSGDAQTYTFQRDPVSDSPVIITDSLKTAAAPQGRKTHFVYDNNGNVLQKDLLYGSSEQVSYVYAYTPDFNQIHTVTDPLQHTTTYGYNAAGCLTSLVDANNNQWTYGCNGSGQRTSTTEYPLNAPPNTVSYTYQGYDLATVEVAVGTSIDNITHYYPDELGRVTSVVDPLGNTTLTSYDDNDRVHTVTDPMGNVTTYQYDYNGNLNTVIEPTDPGTGTSETLQYGYDARNRKTSYTDGFGSLHPPETWSYGSTKDWVSYTDRNGQTTTQKPDDLERVHKYTYADASTITYTLDAADRVTQVVDSASGTVVLTPDDFDRLKTQTAPFGSGKGTVNYQYDNAGRRWTMQITGQAQATYGFDNGDRFTGISLNGETVGIQYDGANRPSVLTLPNGLTTTYTFDAADRLTNLTYKNSGGTTLGTLSYGPDAASRITSVTGAWASNQMPTATTSNYQYGTGALSGDRLSGGNGYAPTYDNQGQMLTDGLGNIYTWNPRHQLTKITNGVTTVAQFTYDALGRRLSKALSGVTTYFLYDNANIIQELKGSTVNNLLTGIDTDQRFARTDVSNTRVYYLTDMLGSTMGLTNAAGTVLQQYTYDPYGVATKLKSTTVNNPYTYTGREDDGTGLYYYRARYYNPVLGRFISEDPIGLDGGPNIYAYVDGNPLSLTDALGFDPSDPTDRSRGDRSRGRPSYGGLPKTGACTVTDWGECQAKCGSKRVLGCYVTFKWKIKGVDEDGFVDRVGEKNIECNCEEPPTSCPVQRK